MFWNIFISNSIIVMLCIEHSFLELRIYILNSIKSFQSFLILSLCGFNLVINLFSKPMIYRYFCLFIFLTMIQKNKTLLRGVKFFRQNSLQKKHNLKLFIELTFYDSSKYLTRKINFAVLACHYWFNLFVN